MYAPTQRPPSLFLGATPDLINTPNSLRVRKTETVRNCRQYETDNWGRFYEQRNNTQTNLQITAPQIGYGTDWREYRAQLVKQNECSNNQLTSNRDNGGGVFIGEELSQFMQLDHEHNPEVWAHRISAPETGCVLLAHPCMFPSAQDYFQYAVVFIVQHDETGSVGLVLNKPYANTLLEWQKDKMQPSVLSPEFDGSRVYSGGVVNQCLEHANLMLPSTDYDPLFLMHTHEQLEGSREVIKGIRIGGIEAAKKAVANEKQGVEDFKVFCGYSGWERGKLMDEVKTRCWFCASVCPSLIFSGQDSPDSREMWHAILEAMGGECRSISLAVREMFREAVLSQQIEEGLDFLQ